MTSPYLPLRCIVLTAGCARSIAEEGAAHAARSDAETGWLLVGRRRTDDCLVLATLPPGPKAVADRCNLSWDREWQARCYREMWETNRGVRVLGSVHTHPPEGTIYLSSADLWAFRGWVEVMDGREGAFGIVNGELRWYSLRAGETAFRPLACEVEPGEDLGAGFR